MVRRARTRRRVAVGATAVIAAAAITAGVAIAVARQAAPKVVVSGRDGNPAPVEPAQTGDWTRVSKAGSGIGAGASLHAIASDGSTLLLGGEKPAPGRYVVTAWRSDDGEHWTESEHPTEHDSITAIASHHGTALAVGAPGGSSAFVWRSSDGGRHWSEIARGPVFGQSVPESRPGAIVSGLLWRDGWWIAYGGSAGGYEAIWVSRDGTEWRAALASRSSGSIDGIVDTPDGSLMAYGVGATKAVSTLEIAWFTDDPTRWGSPVAITTPNRYYLVSVAPGAAFAIGQNIDKHGLATPLLRSTDGGRTWSKDAAFAARFPDAWGWTATTAAGIDVIAGTVTSVNRPAAWTSTNASAWIGGPGALSSPPLPTTTIPQVPPSGALSLVASVGQRIVAFGGDRDLDRFYIYDADGKPRGTTPTPVTARPATP